MTPQKLKISLENILINSVLFFFAISEPKVAKWFVIPFVGYFVFEITKSVITGG